MAMKKATKRTGKRATKKKVSARNRTAKSGKAGTKTVAKATRVKSKATRPNTSKRQPVHRRKPKATKRVGTAYDIIQACSDLWPDNNLFCNKFVIAVAAKFGVTLSGVADDITDEIGGAGWTALQDGEAAGAAAAQGSLVIGAQKGANHVPPANEGHVVVVVNGALAFDKYPTAYWGSDDEGIRKNGGGDHTVNYAYNKKSRDSVVYASINISSKFAGERLGPSTFKGYEAKRFQSHDDDIVSFVEYFNSCKSWISATPKQVQQIPDLSYDLVKSWIIQESGGGDSASLAAWAVDPAQVNVPGDWNDYKSSLGLTKPTAPNSGDIQTNLKAAIGYLARKGFGTSGQPPSNNPNSTFDDWPTALRRYNGRTDGPPDELPYSQRYANQIVARANDPGTYYPIELG